MHALGRLRLLLDEACDIGQWTECDDRQPIALLRQPGHQLDGRFLDGRQRAVVDGRRMPAILNLPVDRQLRLRLGPGRDGDCLVTDLSEKATNHPGAILVAISCNVTNEPIARLALAYGGHADQFDLGRRDGESERKRIVNVAADVGVDEDGALVGGAQFVTQASKDNPSEYGLRVHR